MKTYRPATQREETPPEKTVPTEVVVPNSAVLDELDHSPPSPGLDEVMANRLPHIAQPAAPRGSIQMFPADEPITLPDTRFSPPSELLDRYGVHDFSAERTVVEGEGEKSEPRQVKGLAAITESGAFRLLMAQPGLGSALANLLDLSRTGKDFSSDKEGRQYLLGVFSTAETALSRYIDAAMQANDANAQTQFRLTSLPQYETIMDLLDAIRLEHQAVVARVAQVHSANPQSDELPVYEGLLNQREPEDTAKVRADALASWKNVVSGTGTVRFNDKTGIAAATQKQFDSEHGEQLALLRQTVNAKTAAGEDCQEERLKLAQLENLRQSDAARRLATFHDLAPDDPFRQEALSYIAKMLEVPTGRMVLRAAAKGRGTIFMGHSGKGNNAGSISGRKESDYTELPDNAGGKFFQALPGMNNISQVLHTAALNRKSPDNPGGYDGILLGNKKYAFGRGADVSLQVSAGFNPRKVSGDVGENGMFAQTSPWIVFAHEMAHAVKYQNGLATSVNAGKSFDNEDAFSQSGLRDYAGSEEEWANWHLENAMRGEALIGKKAAYNPYTYYRGFYKRFGSGTPASSYSRKLNALRQTIFQHGLEEDERFAPFLAEFDQKAGELPYLYDNSPPGPDVDIDQAQQAMFRLEVGQNIYKTVTEEKYLFKTVDNFAGGNRGPNPHDPLDEGLRLFTGEVKEAASAQMRSKHRPVVTDFSSGDGEQGESAPDDKFMAIKRSIDDYNFKGQQGLYKVDDMYYTLRLMDQYLADQNNAHQGKRGIVADAHAQLLEALDWLKAPAPPNAETQNGLRDALRSMYARQQAGIRQPKQKKEKCST